MTQCIYLHGFNSSPDTPKAQLVRQFFKKEAPDVQCHAPLLIKTPVETINLLSALIQQDAQTLLIGSSLGGFLATYLVEQYSCLGVLINPLITPQGLEPYLGVHYNGYANQVVTVTHQTLKQLQDLEISTIRHPERFLVLLKTGDSVCPYEKAVTKFAASKKIIHPGGDHAFSDLASVMPAILSFMQDAFFKKRVASHE